MVRSAVISLAALIAAISAESANAEILSVTSSGPGGTTPMLSVESYFNTNDGVAYNANFSNVAPIDILFKVGPTTSPATYYFGLPAGDSISDGAASPFFGFDITLTTIVPGSAILLAGRDPAVFPDVIASDATEAKFSGPPGLQPGASTSVSVTFEVGAFGGDFQYVELALTPSVPEAPTWTMMLAGFAGLGFAGYRASLRRGLA